MPPNFKGSHFVEFTDGSTRVLVLIGATFDGAGHPVYIYDDQDNVYNFHNFISLKKRTRVTNG